SMRKVDGGIPLARDEARSLSRLTRLLQSLYPVNTGARRTCSEADRVAHERLVCTPRIGPELDRAARLFLVNPADAVSAPPGALDETLRDKRFGMVFQPIVDLTRRRVFAYEALVRPHLHSSPPALIADGARQGRLGLLGRTLRAASIAGCPDHPLFINVQPDELLEHFLVQPDDPIFNHSSEEHTSELQSLAYLVCRLLLEKKNRLHAHSIMGNVAPGDSQVPTDSALARPVSASPF